MTFDQIRIILTEKIGAEFVSGEDKGELQPQLNVNAGSLRKVCSELLSNSDLYFDFLSSITAVDNGVSVNTFDLLYHLYSIPYNHSLVLKVTIPRGTEEHLPSVDSICSVWQGANWQEREIYDMFGILFNDHPDLRRILLPEDWIGFPLRKDYQTQEFYHGIKVENPLNN